MLKTSSSFDETIFLLQTSPLFSAVKAEVLEDMLKHFTYITIQKSTMLDSGLNMQYFHIILKGRLRLMQVDSSTGESDTLFLLQEGDVFDIFPLLDGKEHIVQPIAIEDMVILRAQIDKVREWIKVHPEFNMAFMPYIRNLFIDLRNRMSYIKDTHVKNITRL